MSTYDKFLNILIYIGTYVDKNILINCAKKITKNLILDENNYEIEEIHGDLFTESDPTSSLAHCVAKDLGMGLGIATQFKKRFKGVDDLKSQELEIGSVGVLERDGRYIYYLITKKGSRGYPTLKDLRQTLISMKNHALKHNVKLISMPRIGSGLDKLKWSDVKDTLYDIFGNTDITIKVYYL